MNAGPKATAEGTAHSDLAGEREGHPERLDRGEHAGTLIEAEHLGRYRWAAAAAPGARVLDAGCGTAYGTAILAAAGASEVVGVDRDRDVLDAVREGMPEAVRLEAADVLDLPFEADSFDLVVCFEAIEHVVEHQVALDELRRVTSPEGALAISSPNRGVYREDNPFHVHEMTTEELREELAGRFANVGVYRQQVHMASLVSGEDGQALDDPGENLDAQVRKLAGQRPGEELYGLAIAADGELPELPSMVVLAGGVAIRHWQDAADTWESRARHAEAERDATIIEHAHLTRTRDAAIEERDELRRRLAAAGRRGRKLLDGR